MGMLDCSIEEVLCILMTNEHTLDAACLRDKGVPISTFLARYRGIGNMSLRRKQMKVAMEDGNVTMLRWLGIQRLGQSPKVTLLHKLPPGSGGALPPADQPKPEQSDGFEIDGLTDMDGIPDKAPEGIQEAVVIEAEGRTIAD